MTKKEAKEARQNLFVLTQMISEEYAGSERCQEHVDALAEFINKVEDEAKV